MQNRVLKNFVTPRNVFVGIILVGILTLSTSSHALTPRTLRALGAVSLCAVVLGTVSFWSWDEADARRSSEQEAADRELISGITDGMSFLELKHFRYLSENLKNGREPPSSVHMDELFDVFERYFEDLLDDQNYSAYRRNALPSGWVSRETFLAATEGYIGRHTSHLRPNYHRTVLSPVLPREDLGSVYEGEIYFSYRGSARLGLTLRIVVVTSGLDKGVYYEIVGIDSNGEDLEGEEEW